MSSVVNPEYPDWSTWDRVSDAVGLAMQSSLQREIGNRHQLFGIVEKLIVVAADGASDDILAVLPENQETLFLIHPTHSRTPETDPNFPWCVRIKRDAVPPTLSSS